MAQQSFNTMSFGDHLEELRRRLIWGLAGLAPILLVCLLFGQSIMRFLIAPLERQLLRAGQAPTLQALSPVETFGAYIKVSMVATVLLGVPWALWQLWLFVRPGLYETERRFARFLLPLSVVLTFAATSFLYLVMLPVALFFLITFGAGVAPENPPVAPLGEGIVLPTTPVLSADPEDPAVGATWVLGPMHQLRIHVGGGRVYSAPLTSGGLIAQQYRVKEYVDLVFMLGLVFAVAFQTPVVVMLLAWAGIVDPADLARKRKHAFFVCAVLGAVLTPTGDPASMALLTGPLYLLFELGLALARFVPAKRVAGGLLRQGPGRDGDMDDES